MSREAGKNRRDRSISARRARRRVPARSTAPRRASRAPATSQEAAARRFPPTYFADDRRELPSFALVVIGHQPLEQANAIARAPALVDVGFRRTHGGAG